MFPILPQDIAVASVELIERNTLYNFGYLARTKCIVELIGRAADNRIGVAFCDLRFSSPPSCAPPP